MPFWLLLSMQAAGMVVDWLGTKNQAKLMELGGNLQQMGIESSINQTKLEAEDASLAAMKNLRQTMGTQIAAFAARGQKTGVGSALSFMEGSLNNFNSDERMRRMNLLSRVTALRGESALARLQQMGESSKLWQGFASRTFNRFTTLGMQQFGGAAGSAGSAGASSSQGFGLTSKA